MADPCAVKEAEERALKIAGIEPQGKDRTLESMRKAHEAKRIASLNVGSKGLGKPHSGQTIEQTLRDTYKRMQEN